MLLYALLLAASPAVGTDIFKCTDEEGNVAYLQTPCPEAKNPAAQTPVDTEDADAVSDTPAFEDPYTLAPITSDRSFEEIEECKQPYRDEVDEIFAALGGAYTPEQGEDFKKRLRTLTQQMRACG
ncbi:MAG: DUF4124 domain-containing protein [Woeseiaceae bacterium]